MITTEDDLIAFLTERSKIKWGEESKPFYLSMLAPELRQKNVDYQSILNGERLKSFARKHEGPDTYRLIEHPKQRAKVGVIPFDAKFEFENELISETKEEIAIKLARRPHGEKILIDFLRELSKLPDKDLADVNIPLRILVKLIGK